MIKRSWKLHQERELELERSLWRWLLLWKRLRDEKEGKGTSSTNVPLTLSTRHVER